MNANLDTPLEIRDSHGRLCGVYHYQDPFKSFFRGLFTPSGKDVVAPPPPDHPHHHGLQFGLCASDVNFWEESLSAEPSNRQIPIGRQQSGIPAMLPPADGIGFIQQVVWARDTLVTFRETRIISVTAVPGAFVWTWRTTLTAERNVEIIKSVWSMEPGQIGYCGLGLRLAQDLFAGGKVYPPGTASGDTPASVSFQGKGAAVTFQQNATQANALFLSFYGGNPDFAFMALGPTNLQPRSLRKGESLQGTYIVTVADC
ncbi:DUF6807 family protein [Bradyrhizobium prioriisuperbiae]|uniref:DUF6807 family protein n=1 Tax=Bradyrhizobium prioriisuperbiae TaxID=2854389 RepID=UPI0028E9D477|nr:DUF6807 family protein [Bradyrhizobium prioritasuperba]